MDLFDIQKENNKKNNAPLAERMKPRTLDEFYGQRHILSEGKILRRLIKADKLSSIILYGPSGTGKTSLAKIISNMTNSEFKTLNAVTSGVKDIREIIEFSKEKLGMYNKKTILFIDEIHRFSKSQQDALLPSVEEGLITLIGATTENPYYEINSALISRSTIFRLNKLTDDEVKNIVEMALKDEIRGYGKLNIEITDKALEMLSILSDGDARKALNAIEIAVLSSDFSNKLVIDENIIEDCVQNKSFRYDKNGDNHYDIISAYIKSIRGSDADSAVHYLARMLSGGEDIKFIARRLIILASEDIGLANPNALVLATSTFNAIEKIGMPEARIILSELTIYLSLSPKSNSAYIAINKAMDDVKNKDVGEVPMFIRDQKSLKFAKLNEDLVTDKYMYSHDYPELKQDFMPKELKGVKYYFPKKNDYK